MTSATLVFIDSSLDDYQSLARSAATTAEAIVLDGDQDGVKQITAALAGRRGIANVHIFSHGAPGTLRLGSTQLSLETIDRYTDRLKRWKTALADTNLLIYGCCVAAGDRGSQFLQQLSQLTGANIAASAQRTGNAALGGNWDLERQIGNVTAAPVLSPAVMSSYSGVMAICIPNLLYGVSNPANNDPATIGVLNINNGSSVQVGTLLFQTFGLARQGATGRLYYVENTLANPRVAYWDPSNLASEKNTFVGNTGTAGVRFTKLAQNQDGIIYGLDTGSTLYQINPNTGVATSLGNIGGGDIRGSGDIAFDPSDPNRLFVLVAGSNVPEQFYRIFTVDIRIRQAALLGDVTLGGGLLANVVGDESSGALAFGEDGQLYATAQGSNPSDPVQLFRINRNTAAATRVGTTSLPFNDFATLPTPTAEVNLIVTKTDGLNVVSPGDPIVYTIEVTNTTTDCDLNDITVSDFISSTLTGVTWSAAVQGAGTFPTPADFAGTGNTISARINLGAQAKVIYTIRGTVSPLATVGGILTNTVTVTPPPGIINPSPPSTTDITMIVPPDETMGDDCETGRNRRGNAGGNALLGDNDMNVLRGLGGNDLMRGFACPDRLLGGRGNDLIRGGSGSDNLQGQQGNDRLNGGSGSDLLNGGLGNDFLRGGTGSDSLRGGSGSDRLLGENGSDRLLGNLGNDRLDGGAGDDVLRGQQDNDVLRGGAGNDLVLGGVGSDRIGAGSGDDFARGGRGNDLVHGGQGNDQVFGNQSNDVLFGGEGFDRLKGQLDADRLFGGNRADQLFGGVGADRLYGGGGLDLLDGGGGADILSGGANADTLIGGFGADQLTGGGGADRFVYRGQADGGDTITDFDQSEGDLIDLSQIFAGEGYSPTRRFAQYVDLQKLGSNTIVRVDFNGDRRGGFQPLVTLENVAPNGLKASSFILA